MNSEKKKTQDDAPQPSKTIVYLEGEILSVKLNQWGFFGKLRSKYGEYNYKLQDSVSTTNDMIVGLKLVITNGYCYENKKKELIVSDGKFGKIDTEIEIKYVQQVNEETTRLACRIIDKTQIDGGYQILVEIPYPPFKQYKIIINKEKQNQLTDINKRLETFTNTIVMLEGRGSLDDLIVSKLELLNENHYLVKLIELDKGKKSQNSLGFSKLVLNQINYIKNYHSTMKDILFNIRGELSKNTLDDLKELLLSKVLDGEMQYPYNILISKQDIDNYVDTMINFTRDIIYGNSKITNPEELISYLLYYYPAYSNKE